MPYRPAGQMIEQHNETVKESRCADHKNWNQHAPKIAFAMHMAESVATHQPSFAMAESSVGHGNQGHPQDPEPPAAACHAFARELTKRLQQALEFSRARQEAAKQSKKTYFNRCQRPTAFKVGDLVLWEKHRLSNTSRSVSAKLAAMCAEYFLGGGPHGKRLPPA